MIRPDLSSLLRAAALLALLCAGAIDAAAQGTTCDRACLRGFIDGYLESLAARDPAKLAVADTVKFTENGRVLELGEGFWETAGAPHRYRDYVLDAETGGAAVLTAFKEYDGIEQTFMRLKIVDRKIAEVETIVARVGDQRWFAPAGLDVLSGIFAEPVPAAQRSTRAALMAAADAYFTAVQTEGTPEFVQAPFGTGVKRIENGQQTTMVTANPGWTAPR